MELNYGIHYHLPYPVDPGEPAPARRLRFVVNPQTFDFAFSSQSHPFLYDVQPFHRFYLLYLTLSLSARGRLNKDEAFPSTISLVDSFRHDLRQTLRLFAGSIFQDVLHRIRSHTRRCLKVQKKRVIDREEWRYRSWKEVGLRVRRGLKELSVEER